MNGFSGSKSISILRIAQDGEATELDDVVVVEHPMTIYVNHHEVATLMCTPTDLEDLVTGFLISEGLIRTFQAIKQISLSEESYRADVQVGEDITMQLESYGRRTVTSGCGAVDRRPMRLLDSLRVRPLEPSAPVTAAQLLSAMRGLTAAPSLFSETGGTHSCALYRGEEQVCIAEDVGRHNAADKVLGAMHRLAQPATAMILVTTGRISSEIVIKAAVHRVPVVISRSAPTEFAVRIAQEAEILLAGFCRGRRCNVYAGSERLIEGSI
ncbi:MAG: formate dehydrogenase accessory sulfurtransferase FdhD [Alkalispirochaeta sp.]